jgi:hypothetical protein
MFLQNVGNHLSTNRYHIQKTGIRDFIGVETAQLVHIWPLHNCYNSKLTAAFSQPAT